MKMHLVLNNKAYCLLFLVIFSFSSLVKADLDYEVRGVERVSGMFGDAICVSLYIVNDTRQQYSFNLFTTTAKGDGLSSTPSLFLSLIHI